MDTEAASTEGHLLGDEEQEPHSGTFLLPAFGYKGVSPPEARAECEGGN